MLSIDTNTLSVVLITVGIVIALALVLMQKEQAAALVTARKIQEALAEPYELSVRNVRNNGDLDIVHHSSVAAFNLLPIKRWRQHSRSRTA